MNTIGRALLIALAERGAKGIFGIPGDYILPFFKEIQEYGLLPLYRMSHEPSVAYAADGVSRYGRQLGVIAVTYGAGALNVINAVAQANAERSPLVVISGSPSVAERKSGFLLHHQAESIDSQMEIYRHISCAQTRLDDPVTAHLEMARVLDACQRYSRPVYIELPRDMGALFCEAVPRKGLEWVNEEHIRVCATRLFNRLKEAKRPVILAGVEVHRYGLVNEVAAIANRMGIAVANTFMGQGIFAGVDLPWAGTYLGDAGESYVAELVAEADELLLLGVIFSDGNLGVSQVDWGGCPIVSGEHVEIEGVVYNQVSLKKVVDALWGLAVLEEERKIEVAERPFATYLADDQLLESSDIAGGVRSVLKERDELVLVADVGDSLFVSLDIPGIDLVAPAYYASMGFAIPAAMGIQAVSGKRPLVLCGDGSFQMSGMELGNCRRYGWSPIILLLNNQSWEMIRVFQPETEYSFLGDWGYAQLGNDLGGVGIRIQTRKELVVGLERALADPGRFYLLELMLPVGRGSAGLSRFAEAVKSGKGVD